MQSILRRLKILVYVLTTSFYVLSPDIANSQCSSPTLKFHSPELISGISGQIGAIYLFREVIPGVDAHIEIAGIAGGATLYNIDDSTGIGYYDAFQPYVGAAANDTSYIDWKISFKVGGTAADTSLPCLAVTGVDVDGDGAHLQEFIEAATPGSIAVDPVTILNVSFDGVRSKAMSTIYNIPLIDSARHEAMFQMNFVNISTLLYRNGAVSTYGAEQIRQTCIYFKPFFDQTTFVVLPAKILSFTAKHSGEQAILSWSATNEQKLAKYTIQRSADGKSWNDVQIVTPGVSASVNNYTSIDPAKSMIAVFYRVKQTTIYGIVDYSRIVYLKGTTESWPNVRHNTTFTTQTDLQITAGHSEEYVANYYSATGMHIIKDVFAVHTGTNNRSLTMPSSLSPGVYFLVLTDRKGERIYSGRLLKN